MTSEGWSLERPQRVSPARRQEAEDHLARSSVRVTACPRPCWRRCATACWPPASGCGRCWPCWPPRPAAAPRRPLAGGCAVETGSRVFADSRRPARDGRRRPAPRSADLPQEIRRGDGHPRRRRPADAGFRGACRAAIRPPRRRPAASNWPVRSGGAAWSAARSTTSPGSDRPDEPATRRRGRSKAWSICTPARRAPCSGPPCGWECWAAHAGGPEPPPRICWSGSTPMAVVWAWPFRSPMICSTWKEMPTRPASACGRTPHAAS